MNEVSVEEYEKEMTALKARIKELAKELLWVNVENQRVRAELERIAEERDELHGHLHPRS